MNGFDALVFTAGVGENDPEVRKTVCDYLGIFGVKLDDEKKYQFKQNRGGIISSDDSKVTVMVIKTNEELMIARDTKEIVENQKK